MFSVYVGKNLLKTGQRFAIVNVNGWLFTYLDGAFYRAI